MVRVVATASSLPLLPEASRSPPSLQQLRRLSSRALSTAQLRISLRRFSSKLPRPRFWAAFRVVTRGFLCKKIEKSKKSTVFSDMAGRGGNFIARVLQYVVNELLVDRLANNQSFQRFAVRSSKTIEKMAQKGAQTKEELTNQLKEYSEMFGQEIEKQLKDPNKKS